MNESLNDASRQSAWEAKFPRRQRPYTRHRKLKYIKGTSPCGYCGSNQHKDCRVRLDGTLCTCSCQHAQTYRDVYEQSVEIAQSKGEPTPSVLDAIAFMRPVTVDRIRVGLAPSTVRA